MVLILSSLVVIWFHQTGHCLLRFPLPPLVPQEARTIVRRHVDDPEAGQLRRENRGTASQKESSENLDRPAHRASQPRGLSRTSAGDSGLPQRITRDSPGGNSPPGPLPIRLEICETQLRLPVHRGCGRDALAVLTDGSGFILTLKIFDKADNVEYPGAFHIGFMQDSPERVDEIYQRLKSAGFEAEPPKKFHGAWTFYFRGAGRVPHRGSAPASAGRGPVGDAPWRGRGRLPVRRVDLRPPEKPPLLRVAREDSGPRHRRRALRPGPDPRLRRPPLPRGAAPDAGSRGRPWAGSDVSHASTWTRPASPPTNRCGRLNASGSVPAVMDAG